MGAAGGRRTNQRVDKKPRDPCAVVSANCCPKGARRDDRFEEKLGLEAPIAAILALFSHKRVARATSRGSGEASRVGNDVGASLSGFGLEFCWLDLSHLATEETVLSLRPQNHDSQKLAPHEVGHPTRVPVAARHVKGAAHAP